jgi:multidrug transporter EmrE-like cation transporter
LRKNLATVAVCLAGVIVVAALLHYKPPGVDDFLPFYRAAGMLGSSDIFAQTRFGAGGLMFLRTPFYAALLRPLSALPYPVAHAIWTGLMAAAFALAAWLWPGPRRPIAIAMCWACPVAFALGMGQDIALMMLIFAVAGRLWLAEKELAAGLVASLIALKLTLLFPVGLVFLARSRRGFCGLLSGVAAQFALSFALQGPGWIGEYIAVLRSPLLDQVPARMPCLRALVSGVPFAAGAAAIYALLWKVARNGSLRDALTAVLPLGMIAAPHCYAYDAAAAVPLFAAAASLGSVRGILAVAALSPVPYVLMAGEHPTPAGAALFIAAVIACAIPRRQGAWVMAGWRSYKVHRSLSAATRNSLSSRLP